MALNWEQPTAYDLKETLARLDDIAMKSTRTVDDV